MGKGDESYQLAKSKTCTRDAGSYGSRKTCIYYSTNYKVPAECRKLFLQCISGEQQHPFVGAYRDVYRVMLSDMLSSLDFLRLDPLMPQASIRSVAIKPV